MLGLFQLLLVAVSLPIDPEHDPFALIDPYVQLSADELRTRWSLMSPPKPDNAGQQNEGPRRMAPSLNYLGNGLHAFEGFDERTFVDVRLVGFEADGEHEVKLAEEAVQQFLDTVRHEDMHVLRPESNADPSELPVRRRFSFSVRAAPRGLAAKITRVIGDALVGQHDGGVVPLRVLDEIIRSDYHRLRSSHIVLYVLNPRSPRRSPTEAERAQAGSASQRQERSWWQRLKYSYVGDDALGGSGSDDANDCPVTRWVVGAPAKEAAEGSSIAPGQHEKDRVAFGLRHAAL